MNEQTRIRLAIIEAKYGGGRAGRDGGEPRRFEEDFLRLRADVLAPILEEIGAALTAAGHRHRVDIGAGEQPSIELHVLLDEGDSASTGVIRLFALTAGARRCQIIAELQLKRTVSELTRFDEVLALTPEVLEHLIVDAVEQVFAYHRSS